MKGCKHEAYDGGTSLHKPSPGTLHLSNDDDGYYTQIFESRAELDEFIRHLNEVADRVWPRD